MFTDEHSYAVSGATSHYFLYFCTKIDCMKVIVDDKIPYIHDAIESIADEVLYIPGDKFSSQTVRDADALIIRTRTHCNRELLENSKVRFIATATIGYDHIDTEYCRQAGIYWTNAPGSNSSSVAQYIESCLILLETDFGFSLHGKTVGIIGVGNVGTKVKDLAEHYGMRVLLNDPPRAEKENNIIFTGLDRIMAESDIITFHTPLVTDEPFPTWHMGNEAFFRSLRRKPFIINTSRGEVIDTRALLSALDTERISGAIIDVWENEPDINKELLEKALIATPHIAGYSADGKANATRMSLDALCKFFQMPADYTIVPPAPVNDIIEAKSREDALLKMYDPRTDSALLKANPEKFEWFRGNYPLRREKEAYRIVM